MTSLSQRRSGARNGARLAEAAISEEKARQAAVADQEHAAGVARRKAAREAEAARVKFTADDLAGASHVRDAVRWHRVVRVSAKSVTVATAYSWTDRIPIGRVLQYAIDGKAVSTS
ncbi:hypothetical protein F9L07_22805 [Pimelobacter simplex]|uniref:Uncharacterized protein n=1 Tax=Nocardioides simplex TaxID=2045 RepID=A0A7J5DT80_NOCSI|nr:hypothetical protein [Pimelobacter simplex]KAB2808349.1 hypothetical protein F9L07_22805 [Pimelobacter simplex]